MEQTKQELINKIMAVENAAFIELMNNLFNSFAKRWGIVYNGKSKNKL